MALQIRIAFVRALSGSKYAREICDTGVFPADVTPKVLTETTYVGVYESANVLIGQLPSARNTLRPTAKLQSSPVRIFKTRNPHLYWDKDLVSVFQLRKEASVRNTSAPTIVPTVTPSGEMGVISSDGGE